MHYMSGRGEIGNRLYYEYDREGNVFVVYRYENDGDRAIDVLDDIEEIYERYPSAVSKYFLEFIEEMETAKKYDKKI